MIPLRRQFPFQVCRNLIVSWMLRVSEKMPPDVMRLQFLFQGSATGLPRRLAAVRIPTTVPVAVICNWPGKGLATVRIATTVPVPGISHGTGRGLARRCEPRLQFLFQVFGNDIVSWMLCGNEKMPHLNDTMAHQIEMMLPWDGRMPPVHGKVQMQCWNATTLHRNEIKSLCQHS